MALAAPPLRAHEVLPTIADFKIEDGMLTLGLRMNVEAFVAEIDLDGLADTNLSEKTDTYDRLRRLPPEELAPMVREWAPGWLRTLRIEAGGPVPMHLAALRIPPVDDPDYPRPSEVLLQGPVPAHAQHLVVAWPDGAGGLVLRQQEVENPYTGFIEGGGTSPPIEIGGGFFTTWLGTLAAYVPVGFDHILPRGLDHILFVLGLFFLSVRFGALLWQVSAFTLAHTITLALGALGVVAVPPAIVEPLIAASITYVAVENLFTSRLHRWRPLVVFGFGLLHGLGFAAVLEQFGLPAGRFVPALLGFNIGVELGQLTVLAAAFVALGYPFGHKPWYRRAVAIPASLAIASIGAYWFVERLS